MIKQTIEKLFNGYPTFDVKEVFPFKKNPLAAYIRHEVARIFKEEFQQFPTLIWDASPGKGQWADAPWIAAFNPLVTETAQDGYYPVILFTSEMDGFYLSLNQGMTKVRKEFGNIGAVEILQHRAKILRYRLSEDLKQSPFSQDPIDLRARGTSTRLAYYEPGHAFGKYYQRDNLPSEDGLNDDITNMLSLYAKAHSKGGVSEYDMDESLPDQTEEEMISEVQEKIKYKIHKSIERKPSHSKKVKKILGYTCQICGFNFENRYGPLGKDFIEAHHKVPLHTLPTDQFVTITIPDDFAVVCSNCHRMLHRKNAPEGFEEFLETYSFA